MAVRNVTTTEGSVPIRRNPTRRIPFRRILKSQVKSSSL